ncbi:MAG: 1-deoxy-D-xylulose-5-phosphate synthase [Clostridiales bacterium]|nr:1-deoxy-D-xylulose-5-phosphate synthase [Clostridiales bacterium]
MRDSNFINKLKLPQDIKGLTLEQKKHLCDEIRSFLIESVGKTGGHLASNLGTVELTVALHSVFSSPHDKIVWDVGHQSYTHKILTGRLDKFNTLRQLDGISGFPKPSESEHDSFISGHSSTSISAAFGLATAMRLQGDDNSVVAVIGDGALTGGLAYEGLNNAGKSDENLIILLNHNDMSISKNVGAFARYLAHIRSKPSYFKTKAVVKKTITKTPIIGKGVNRFIHAAKTGIKEMLYHSNIFESFGFIYLGPIDGHNIAEVIKTLEVAKRLKRPVVVHANTIKGKGLPKAEENPGAYHGLSKCSTDTDVNASIQDNFSNVFGKKLADLADKDDKICAITAAMKYGTGLQFFYCRHKNRFFDVGIAEQHGVTFAAGLSTMGMKPVFAVYSSFLQRSYDQVLHDAAIANTHLVLAVDRAGIVGEDGETHQGLFDVSFLSTMPNVTILSPSTYSELEWCVESSLYDLDGVVALRYPRGKCSSENINICEKGQYYHHDRTSNARILVITYGRIYSNAIAAVKELRSEGVNVDILKLVKIHPIEQEVINIAKGYDGIIFIEEGMGKGSIAEGLGYQLGKELYKIYAITGFVKQSTVEQALEIHGLDKKSIFNNVKTTIKEWDID